jgi:hypothetical protein
MIDMTSVQRLAFCLSGHIVLSQVPCDQQICRAVVSIFQYGNNAYKAFIALQYMYVIPFGNRVTM